MLKKTEAVVVQLHIWEVQCAASSRNSPVTKGLNSATATLNQYVLHSCVVLEVDLKELNNAVSFLTIIVFCRNEVAFGECCYIHGFPEEGSQENFVPVSIYNKSYK